MSTCIISLDSKCTFMHFMDHISALQPYVTVSYVRTIVIRNVWYRCKCLNS